MPTIWRLYSGSDGRSHLEQVTLSMKPFVDVEGAHGEAAATELPGMVPPELKVSAFEVHFPERQGERLVTRAWITLPEDAGFKPVEGPRPNLRLIVAGVVAKSTDHNV